jgi:hypothetical protein
MAVEERAIEVDGEQRAGKERLLLGTIFAGCREELLR